MYGTLISSVTVGAGGAASIDFTSIPGTYTDLYLVLSGRGSGAAVTNFIFINVNGSTTGYSNRFLVGTGSSVYSSTYTPDHYNTDIGVTGSTATANTFGNTIVAFPNYAGSTAKSASLDAVAENNAAASGESISAMLWSGTAAITSISVTTSGNFAQYSTAYLYGLLKGSGGATAA